MQGSPRHDDENVPFISVPQRAVGSLDSDLLEEEQGDLYNAIEKKVSEERRRSSVIEAKYKKAQIPNYSIPKRLSLVAPQFIDENELTAAQRKAARYSILAPEEVRLLTDDQAQNALSFAKRLEAIFLLALSVTLNGVDPLLDQWAVIVPGSSRKEFRYIPQSPFIVSYALNGLSAAIFAFFVNIQTAKAVWKPKAILAQVPIAMAFVFGDWACAFCALKMSASLIKVISQTKLIVTATFAWIILGTTQTLTQWILILASTVLIVSYGMLDGGDLSGEMIGVAVAIIDVVVGCGSGVLSELTMKRVKYRYMAQMAHNRWACLLVSMVQMCFILTKTQQWHQFPFGGWGMAQIMIVLVDYAKAWTTMLILKRLNSVWKVLAGALSLGFTYVMSSILFSEHGANPFSWSAFSIVAAISLLILAYASSKRDESKLLQLKVDVDKRADTREKA
eukprot:Gregarina_sp_Poly_1__7647@NODE_42_length_18083_cov_98_634880_g36_i0_p5_GENE_NODE_42_length_18083_cov_98_634880_g36_i0NODE_42_length_18083_cov_98_634880_g36_i0_p5_ORF_typecomplete_len449_score57_53Nuc_sug_transp/PF04142_15/4_6e17TPT/PF03151_16/1_2e03TPT/PF03151_16/3_7e07CRTlike/PF08627_10/2_2e05CRTlike/PF08627_10/25EamA/PF00892_20/8e05EamA/PF00892_20/24PUNUT/PF16913_5/0_00035PUNUT/PF16913_5/1_4e02Cytochrom_B558a/PF05038_13/2e03Cytochrom_B558a/PF05038_13/1_4e02Cytochrom_B558a/PF05038_13/1_3_NODE_4